jgi:hypothetical protein
MERNSVAVSGWGERSVNSQQNISSLSIMQIHKEL